MASMLLMRLLVLAKTKPVTLLSLRKFSFFIAVLQRVWMFSIKKESHIFPKWNGCKWFASAYIYIDTGKCNPHAQSLECFESLSRTEIFRYLETIKHLKWASLVAQMVKNLPAMRKTRSIPGLERSLGEGNGNPLQYSYLENTMDREAW